MVEAVATTSSKVGQSLDSDSCAEYPSSVRTTCKPDVVTGRGRMAHDGTQDEAEEQRNAAVDRRS